MKNLIRFSVFIAMIAALVVALSGMALAQLKMAPQQRFVAKTNAENLKKLGFSEVKESIPGWSSFGADSADSTVIGKLNSLGIYTEVDQKRQIQSFEGIVYSAYSGVLQLTLVCGRVIFGKLGLLPRVVLLLRLV
ncbi:MAG: hypothetical protein HY974_03100 [Candidatus Kerfeldbacteria bacterium]|nr:hypothetical protein [Candidatus Kerfeldbacteria bacterium]